MDLGEHFHRHLREQQAWNHVAVVQQLLTPGAAQQYATIRCMTPAGPAAISNDALAAAQGISTRTVQRRNVELQDQARIWITPGERQGRRKQGFNVYTIIPCDDAAIMRQHRAARARQKATDAERRRYWQARRDAKRDAAEVAANARLAAVAHDAYQTGRLQGMSDAGTLAKQGPGRHDSFDVDIRVTIANSLSLIPDQPEAFLERHGITPRR